MSDNGYYCSQKFWWLSVDIEKLSTQSCCSASPHSVDISWLKNNPGRLFNTVELHQERQMMLDGFPVSTCTKNCWVPESNKLISRRLSSKSDQKTHTSLESKPENLEIMVGSNCNLTCVYCCKQYSTAWYNDIDSNGSYPTVGFDDRFTLNTRDRVLHKLSQKDLNLSVNQRKLLDEIHTISHNSPITSIDVTGGETFLYLYLVDLIKLLPSTVKINIYTGLGVDEKRFAKELDKLSSHPNVCLVVSAESIGKYYEFIRFGNSWDRVEHNLQAIRDRNMSYKFNATISNLTLFGLKDFAEYTKGIDIDYQLCNDPIFLAINVLDDKSKEIIYNYINQLPEYAQNLIKSSMNQTTTDTQRMNLKKYLSEFAKRRNLSLDIFPETFINWINDVV